MRSQTTINIVTYGILALAGGVSLTLPSHLDIPGAQARPGSGDPEVNYLPGVIRDFRSTHGDFNVSLSTGSGHYAGNVAHTLNAAHKPAFSGAGFKVTKQWTDDQAHPIAPHMYIDHAVGRRVQLANSPSITGSPTLDTYDSTIGPYGGTNKGPAPTFSTGTTMPTLTVPTGMPAKVSEFLRAAPGTTTLSSDLYCDKFIISNTHVLTISGERRIRVVDTFVVENFAKIELQTGATLSIWFDKDAKLQNGIGFNANTKNPSRVTIYNLGTQDFIVENSADVYFTLVAPTGGLHVKNNAQFFGRCTSKDLTIDNTSGFHLDINGYGRICGNLAADVLGTAGTASKAGIASASSFTDWYTDTMGVNLSMRHDLAMTLDGDGVWEHHDDTFLPIDGMLFGNEGMAHNFFFTFEVNASFTHHACDKRFLEFQGADDAWLFINGRLVLDIGGVLPNQVQRIDVDRLSLTNGNVYQLAFLYAHRQPNAAKFHLRTNLDLLKSSPAYTLNAGVD